MKSSPKYLTLFTLLFALFQSPGLSASVHYDNACCELTSGYLADEVTQDLISKASTPPQQIQILFSHSQSQIAAKERRILIPLLATGLLTLLVFVRI